MEAWEKGICTRGDIDRILEATARIPYHLAKVGAMIGAGGRSCRAVADDLASLLAEGDTYRSTRLALRDLPADDADLWRDLAVFPEYEAIPLAEIARAWGTSSTEEARNALDRLAGKHLLTFDHQSDTVRVKRAEILLEAGGPLAAARRVTEMHRKMVNAYAALLEPKDLAPSGERDHDWCNLPEVEREAWDHLVYHIAGTGEREMLRAVARDTGFLAAHAWVSRPSGPSAVQRDLAIAFAELPNDKAIEWLVRLMEIAGHLLAHHPSREALAASLRLLILDADAPPGIDLARLNPFLPEIHLAPKWRWPSRFGVLRREVCPTEDAVNALAFARDGRLAVAFASDHRKPESRGAVQVWASDSLERMTEIDAGGTLTALAFPPRGAVLGGAADGRVLKLDVGNRAPEELGQHQGAAVGAVAVSADGSLVASRAIDGTLRVTDSADGSLVASRAPDGTLQFGPGDGVSMLDREADGEGASAVAFSPAAAGVLAIGGEDGGVQVWKDLVDGAAPIALRLDEDMRVTAVAFSPSGNLLACAQDSCVELWDVSAGEEPVRRWAHDDGASAIDIVGDDERPLLALGGKDGVSLWRPGTESGAAVIPLDSSSPVGTLAFSPDGSRLASGDDVGRVRMWDVQKAEDLHSTAQEMRGISAIAMSPDGALLATGGFDGQVRLCRAKDGREKELWPFDDERVRVRSLTFAANSKLLAWSGDGARVVTVANLASGGTVTRLHSPRPVGAFALSPEGARIAAVCGDGRVRVWDTRESGGPPRELRSAGRRFAGGLVFSSHLTLVAAGPDGLVRWEMGAGDDGVLLVPHGGAIGVVACCLADGSLAFGCEDGRIGLLAAGGDEMRYLRTKHPAAINALAFSGDGSLLASAAVDGSAHLVRLAPERLLVQADAGVRGLGLALAAQEADLSGSRMALLLDGAVLMTEMVDRRPKSGERL